MLFKTYMLYFITCLLLAILGTFYSKVFFSFLLLDLIDRSVILNNVIKAITANYKQLLMTAFMGLMLIYIYAVIGYLIMVPAFIPDGLDDPDEEGWKTICPSIWVCFLTILNQGLRQGGGIGEVLVQITYGEEAYTKRFFYDLLFFLLIIIICLNCIFGVIVDTFGELRDQKSQKGIFC